MLNIRPAKKSDLENLKSVIDSSRLFPSSMLPKMMDGFFKKTEECIWLTLDINEPSMVAYAAHEKLTDGTWNLYLIASHPLVQGRGYGKKMIAHIETELKKKKVRVLVVETSGLPEYEISRKFYEKCGFNKEATIRDFYDKGDDKVVYWKKLS